MARTNTACRALREISSCRPIRRERTRDIDFMTALKHIFTSGSSTGDDYPGGGDRRVRAQEPGYYERLRRYRIAVFVLMIGVLMIFIGLTSAYVFRQGWATEDPHTHEYT